MKKERKVLATNWSLKYGRKSFSCLSKGTKYWYSHCGKIGRDRYLKISRYKTNKFKKENPGNLSWRVFKSTSLKGKKLSPKIELVLKTVIIQNKSVKGISKVIETLKGK